LRVDGADARGADPEPAAQSVALGRADPGSIVAAVRRPSAAGVAVYSSDDDGDTWTARGVAPDGDPAAVAILGSRIAVASRVDDLLLLSDDDGATFSARALPQVDPLDSEPVDVLLHGARIYVSVAQTGFGPSVYASDDAGVSFTLVPLATTAHFNSIFDDGGVLYALGSSFLYRSDDGGDSWTYQGIGASSLVRSTRGLVTETQMSIDDGANWVSLEHGGRRADLLPDGSVAISGFDGFFLVPP
jgi:hypothetical protein